MGKYLIIIVSMVLVNNYPLAQFLGICPFLGVSKDKDSATGMGIAVTFVMVLATAVTWPIQQLLNKFGIGYMQTAAQQVRDRISADRRLHSRYRCSRAADRDVHEEEHGRTL